MRIYCDGIFDLFHIGHLNHFKKIHEMRTDAQLIVGIIDDKTAERYKRKPICTEKQRCAIISSIKYVDECFITDVLEINEEFLNIHDIDYVLHAFNDTSDKEKQSECFKIPILLNKFIEIPYNYGVSTTQIIKNNNLNWSEIWEKKGYEETEDLFLLNGWSGCTQIFNPCALTEKIIYTLGISDNESIIEFGCGAGLLTNILHKKYKYIGVDNSISLICKNIKITNGTVLHHDITHDTIFKTKYFDYGIINSVLEYLSSMEDVEKSIHELEKNSKRGVYIANIRYKTRTESLQKHTYDGIFTHLVIDKMFFSTRGYTILESLYDPHERYDAYKLM